MRKQQDEELSVINENEDHESRSSLAPGSAISYGGPVLDENI